jgi:hypothetical protein
MLCRVGSLIVPGALLPRTSWWGLAAMRTVKHLVLVGAALSVFAGSFSALAEDKKSTKAPAGHMAGKGGKTSAKDIAAKGLKGKGGAGDAAGGVGGAVGDAIGGTVGGAVGGALGGFLGGLGR